MCASHDRNTSASAFNVLAHIHLRAETKNYNNLNNLIPIKVGGGGGAGDYVLFII